MGVTATKVQPVGGGRHGLVSARASNNDASQPSLPIHPGLALVKSVPGAPLSLSLSSLQYSTVIPADPWHSIPSVYYYPLNLCV